MLETSHVEMETIGSVCDVGEFAREWFIVVGVSEQFGSELGEGREVGEHEMLEKRFQFVEFVECDGSRGLQVDDAIAARNQLGPAAEEQGIRFRERSDMAPFAVGPDGGARLAQRGGLPVLAFRVIAIPVEVNDVVFVFTVIVGAPSRLIGGEELAHVNAKLSAHPLDDRLVELAFEDGGEKDGLAGVVREEEFLLLGEEVAGFTVVLGGIQIHHVQKPQGEVLFIGTVDRKVERGGMEGDGGF